MFYRDHVLHESILDKFKDKFNKSKGKTNGSGSYEDPNDWEEIASYVEPLNKYMKKIVPKIKQSLNAELKKTDVKGISIVENPSSSKEGLAKHDSYFEYIGDDSIKYKQSHHKKIPKITHMMYGDFFEWNLWDACPEYGARYGSANETKEYTDFWELYHKLNKIISDKLPNGFKTDDGGDWDGGSVYVAVPISWIKENLMRGG